MNIWNKVLLCFVMVLSLAFLYLAVKDLKLHREWGDLAKSYLGTEEELGSIDKELKIQDEATNGVLADGEVVTPGIEQLSVDVNRLMLERGRAWFSCRPEMVDQTGIRVKTLLPNPNGITAKSAVYVFEQNPAGQGCGNYLGQFSVVAVAPEMVQLQPSRSLSPQEIERVEASAEASRTSPDFGWTLYETLPVDDPDAFKDLTPEQIEDLPADVVAGYTEEDRKLRDYEIFFRVAHRLRSRNADMLASAARDEQYLNSANADAIVQEQFRRKDINDLDAEKTALQREADAVKAHRNNLQGKVDAVRTAIIETIQKNIDLAGEISRRQLEATRKTDKQPPPGVAQVAGK